MDDDRIKTVAKFLENFAREVEKETREFPSVLMLDPTPNSWVGFTHEAILLLTILEEKK